MYPFPRRHELSVRVHRGVTQRIDPVMRTAKHDHWRSIMTAYSMRVSNPKLFRNMDQTSVFINCIHNRSLHALGKFLCKEATERQAE